MMVLLVLVGCSDKVEARVTDKPAPTHKESVNSKKSNDIVYLNLDDMSFKDAFDLEHRAKGPGKTFYWRGSLYTTDLAEPTRGVEIANTYNDGTLQWVRNMSDLDDFCKSNELDACGICDGTGPIMWYLDRDADGLGDPNTFTKTCVYPGADDE